MQYLPKEKNLSIPQKLEKVREELSKKERINLRIDKALRLKEVKIEPYTLSYNM